MLTSIGAVTAMSLGAVACSSDDESADPATSIAETASSETASSATPPADSSTIQTAAGAPDETAATVVAETAAGAPDETAATVVAETTGSTDQTATSEDLDDYIDSLASTTDNFDDLTTTPEETRCAATAILTPIGVDTLQREQISVDDVNDDLDLTEVVTVEAAAAIADGLVDCGLGIRFAASLAEGETTEDLDDAQEAELFECVSAALDEDSARETLNGFLSPADVPDPSIAPSRYTAGVFLSGLIRDCGFEATVYP